MNKLIPALFFAAILFSANTCNKVFDSASVEPEEYLDTIYYTHNGKFVVLPVQIKNTKLNMIFDTGADLSIRPNEGSGSKKKIRLTDSSGKSSTYYLVMDKNVHLSELEYSNMYSVLLDLPEPLLCYCDGIMGNTLIRSSNWKIERDKVIVSDKVFTADSNAMEMEIYYQDANSLYANLKVNDMIIDNCLLDYGGVFDIELPLSYYQRNPDAFKDNSFHKMIKTSYGVNGKSDPDTVLQINCNLILNGLPLNHVNIGFRNNNSRRIGYRFFERFGHVVINNSTEKMYLWDFEERKEDLLLLDFDLQNGLFEVSRMVIVDHPFEKIAMGDKFVQINSKRSADFKDYCEFLSWKDSLGQADQLHLVDQAGNLYLLDNRMGNP